MEFFLNSTCKIEILVHGQFIKKEVEFPHENRLLSSSFFRISYIEKNHVYIQVNKNCVDGFLD
jgi:hypothetical protein